MYRRFDILILMLSLLAGCTLIEKNDDGGGGIAPPTPVYPQPYAQPSVSPDGRKLLFVRNKVTRITKSGFFSIDPDSSGIWLADADGINMELLLKGQNFGSPGFSPNMKWILFEAGAQIYKVPFAGDSIDADSIIQLTNQGRNFFPGWSPDGQQIAYSQSICDEVKKCGIWLFNLNTNNERNIVKFGNYPDWHPSGNKVLYRTRAVKSTGEVIGDSLWTYNLTNSTSSHLTFLEGTNRYPRYSPYGTQIAFQSNGQVWVMNADGSDPKQIQPNGGMPDWTPNGNIVYVCFDPRVFSRDNGTIWIMDADGSNKKQLTRNYGLILEQ